MTASSLAITVNKVSADSANAPDREYVEDRVAVEEPLEIRLGHATPEGRTASSISITMRTPGNDAELAVGEDLQLALELLALPRLHLRETLQLHGDDRLEVLAPAVADVHVPFEFGEVELVHWVAAAWLRAADPARCIS